MPSAHKEYFPCPGPRVLALCAAVLLAGYFVLVMRGPSPAAEVRVSLFPAEETSAR